MAKSASLRKSLSFVIWLTGVIVSLSVAFAMAYPKGPLASSFPTWLGGEYVAVIAGWVVIITTVLGVVLAIIDYLT